MVPSPHTQPSAAPAHVGPPTVLFVGARDAATSQMAAALLATHAAGRVHALSAGSAPAVRVDPAAVAAMAEVGIDLTTRFPKPLTADAVLVSDVVVTLGGAQPCPVLPGTRYLAWPVEDPSSRDVAGVRPVRDELDRRVRGLLTELG
ncbi:Protein-tyrosine-phosphatase [Geodermatophilus dictyosporus]|uniref:Protein-tyrosine-phosphatase n=1 Tax=Geodermatophilus dictyosporus TaxID=1523247 RepID=A0A1I5U6W9_9ACTN|nr:arsenate reductase ArsC [Geodermatophilus dictyosporus]SFP91015.1 Protein-tyrosine-phosphatase [Geodermatophilus dictyosporus]